MEPNRVVANSNRKIFSGPSTSAPLVETETGKNKNLETFKRKENDTHVSNIR